MKKTVIIIATVCMLFTVQMANANQDILPEGVTIRQNIPYVTGGGIRQQLDVYLPEVPPSKPLPAIIRIHGGSWIKGDKAHGRGIADYVLQGYIGVSINYRYSTDAVFPAQIEDCKAAVRYLRAHASEYHIDPDHIAAWGTSAGGHLAAMLGTAGDVQEFDKGENLDFSSRVQAVCDYFGPTDFIESDDPATFQKCDREGSSVRLLIGGPMRDNPDKCASASPIYYVAPNNPPFLILHGDKDRTVPINQSELLTEELKEKGVPVFFHVVMGGGHGGPEFNTPLVKGITDTFFERTLKVQSAAKFSKLSEPLKKTRH